ncbi:repressor LexA [Candidatus Collierbacteria bacterium RIFCSPHIGHO2_02_FULL_49_10]|uniref:LexA repressor n=1 Tax=Candidatus Collierbacteria bacterium RIFCSPHIGHO2_02_FULL_49_10 TaxID=1817723 RepID=A0A1F5EWW2_9BACT|nr:MAG: repressor LexA [Candidatus Collierbacteria bacterium RIFCSPHIGHO2_02_FULL_49_10]
MAVTLYKRQRQIVEFIGQFIQKNGYSPTLSEIAGAIGVSSLATVHEHLQALIKKKIIRKYEGAIRGIELIEKHMGEALSSVELPIMGFIAAGQPIQPYSDPDATMRIAPSLVSGKKRAFVLQVKGASMIEEGIFDKDYVVIEEEDLLNVRDGDIVVALLENGLTTLKRFFREKTRIRLEPANSSMSPIYATNLRIQGKLKAVIRKY